jgi:hypothetical protein
VKNEEVLNAVQEERKVLDTIRRKRANWIGHNLPSQTRYGRKIGGRMAVKEGG